jgi:hypothetical protein
MTTINRLADLIEELYTIAPPNEEMAKQMAEDLLNELYKDNPYEMLAILRDYEAAYWTNSGFVTDLVEAIYAHIRAKKL